MIPDLADLHVRAMTLPEGGQRFIAAGEFMWMIDMANTLRSQLGSRRVRVPRHRLPDFVVRLILPIMPQLRGLAPLIGHKFPLTTEKGATRARLRTPCSTDHRCRMRREPARDDLCLNLTHRLDSEDEWVLPQNDFILRRKICQIRILVGVARPHQCIAMLCDVDRMQQSERMA
jgi:hypothetical protein